MSDATGFQSLHAEIERLDAEIEQLRAVIQHAHDALAAATLHDEASESAGAEYEISLAKRLLAKEVQP